MANRRSNERSHAGGRKRDSTDSEVTIAYDSAKRRKLSDGEDDIDAPTINGNTSDVERRGEGDEDGWQRAPLSRKHRKQQNQPERRDDHASKRFPKLTFTRRVTKPLTVDQLRDLALYVLAEGIGPDWVAVANSRDISKVVVMMVPGLDIEARRRLRELVMELKRLDKHETDSKHVDTENHADRYANTDLSEKNEGHNEYRPNIIKWDGIDEFLDLPQMHHGSWLLEDTIPVKAPGDAKFSKVHSPLQAMLIAPEANDKVKPGHNAEKQFRPINTPITHFIHTADDLREAEYPIHPATFTSQADAALEASRRSQTDQSEAAGWVDAKVTESRPLIPPASVANPRNPLSQGLNIYAVDCEMVLTSDKKSSLARISVVSWPVGEIIIDKYVKPELPIENYFTQYSGITPEILENVTTTLPEVQQELTKLLTPSTVLLGHSFESDLCALKMTHPFIVDTSMLFPHPRGLPMRSSLKFLANKYLKREIQTGGADGHNSVEDARAVLDLVKLKCEKGPKFGTTEAHGEPIFKRLGRYTDKDGKPLTSAIVEYGAAPERGLGKDATHAIGCQTDEEITAGMIRAINGEEDEKQIPAGGVNFTWGRLRAIEFARGWVTNNNSNANVQSNVEQSEEGDSKQDQNSAPSQEVLDKTLLRTFRLIIEIRNSLPPSTLFMIYNGISDVRPVLKLQAMQSQYRKEFKTKKWNELTVQWTDTEQQALKNAAERARQGWGWVEIIPQKEASSRDVHDHDQ